MTNLHSIAILGIRLIAGLILYHSFFDLFQSGDQSSIRDFDHLIQVNGPPAIRFAAGCILLGLSSMLGRRLVPSPAGKGEPITMEHLQGLAVGLAGLYCLLSGVAAAGAGIWELIVYRSDVNYTWPDFQPHQNAFHAVCFLIVGVFFLCRRDQVIQWLRKLSGA